MKTLILSPHIDDELIGCYSVLSSFRAGSKTDILDVMWLYETTEERLKEGHALADHFGFTGAMVFSAQVPELIIQNRYDKVYVPARQDWHIDHKTTNQLFRQYATNFYSVDMVNGVPLDDKEVLEKKTLLDQFYPSQAKLWEHDAKYYLFDAISDTDVTFYTKKRYGYFSLSFPYQYRQEVHAVVLKNISDFNAMKLSAFNKVVSVCPIGDVTYEHVNGCIYKI